MDADIARCPPGGRLVARWESIGTRGSGARALHHSATRPCFSRNGQRHQPGRSSKDVRTSFKQLPEIVEANPGDGSRKSRTSFHRHQKIVEASPGSGSRKSRTSLKQVPDM